MALLIVTGDQSTISTPSRECRFPDAHLFIVSLAKTFASIRMEGSNGAVNEEKLNWELETRVLD